MKGSIRESNPLKRSQYSSRILISPGSGSKSTQKNIKRGNSSEPYNRQQEQYDNNEAVNIGSLITQSTKNGRPLTGINLNSFGQNIK